MVLLEPSTERDLVVLDDENGGDALHRREVGSLMRRGGVGRAITDPRQRDARLALQLERERDPGDHGHHVTDVGNGLEDAVPE